MVSDALAGLSDLLISEAAHGRALPLERAAAIAALLLDLSQRVAVMEGQPIPETARGSLADLEVAQLVEQGWTEDDARSWVRWERES